MYYIKSKLKEPSFGIHSIYFPPQYLDDQGLISSLQELLCGVKLSSEFSSFGFGFVQLLSGLLQPLGQLLLGASEAAGDLIRNLQ